MEIIDLNRLKNWFLSEKRDLPWRNSSENFPSPYAVWVSEIMLQQTQVAVVIPYFERWMREFPTIHDLAKAPLEEILKSWEGLGYYSRARNLHQGAQYIVEHYHGELPNSAELLQKIKGIGPYTVGAILNFAFHKRFPAVDGNVLRVLARYYAIMDDISNQKTVKNIRSKTETLLPQEEPWIISEGLIELGATICTRTPQCTKCPLKSGCQARLKDIQNELPKKSPSVTTTKLYRAVAVLNYQNQFLLKKGTAGDIMADLYEFPYFEWNLPTIPLEEVKQQIEEKFQLSIVSSQKLQQVSHSFTRYRAFLTPHLFKIKHIKPIDGYTWHDKCEFSKLTFSSGHRKILRDIVDGK